MLLQWYLWRESYSRLFPPLSRHFPLFVSKLNFWPFFPNLCLLMVNHLIPALLLLREILSLDAVKIICMKRKLFHVVSTPFSRHYPSLAWITIFFPNLRVFMGNPLTLHLRFFIKMLSLDAVAILNMERRLFQVVSTSLPAISCYLPENSIFGHLPPFVPAYGRPLDPTSTFIDKNVITGCYCNNINGEKAIPGCFHPIVLPSPAIYWKFNFRPFTPICTCLWATPWPYLHSHWQKCYHWMLLQ